MSPVAQTFRSDERSTLYASYALERSFQRIAQMVCQIAFIQILAANIKYNQIHPSVVERKGLKE